MRDWNKFQIAGALSAPVLALVGLMAGIEIQSKPAEGPDLATLFSNTVSGFTDAARESFIIYQNEASYDPGFRFFRSQMLLLASIASLTLALTLMLSRRRTYQQ